MVDKRNLRSRTTSRTEPEVHVSDNEEDDSVGARLLRKRRVLQNITNSKPETQKDKTESSVASTSALAAPAPSVSSTPSSKLLNRNLQNELLRGNLAERKSLEEQLRINADEGEQIRVLKLRVLQRLQAAKLSSSPQIRVQIENALNRNHDHAENIAPSTDFSASTLSEFALIKIASISPTIHFDNNKCKSGVASFLISPQIFDTEDLVHDVYIHPELVHIDRVPILSHDTTNSYYLFNLAPGVSIYIF